MKGNRGGARRAAWAAVAAALTIGSAAAAQTNGGGMRVYVDPHSGERTSPPPAAALQGAGATPALGLVEEVNPEGGYVIDLKRRFRGGVAARVNAGEVSVGCEAGAVTATEKQP